MNLIINDQFSIFDEIFSTFFLASYLYQNTLNMMRTHHI